MNPMRRNAIGGLLAAFWLGCASQAQQAPPREPARNQLLPPAPMPEAAAQLPAATEVRGLERHAREQLDVLELELGRIALRLEYEGTREQVAEWASTLSDIEHDRRILDYELGLAERAPHPEFMDVGPVVAMIDMLSAIAARAIIEIDQALDAGPNPEEAVAVSPASLARFDLCAVQVEGAHADVRQQGERMLVELTAPHPDVVAELRQRALELPVRALSSTGTASEPSAQVLLIIDIAIEDADHGVRLVLTPDGGQMSLLQEELHRHIERMANRSC